MPLLSISLRTPEINIFLVSHTLRNRDYIGYQLFHAKCLIRYHIILDKTKFSLYDVLLIITIPWIYIRYINHIYKAVTSKY